MNSKTKTSKLEKEKNVQVFVRVRPMNQSEKSSIKSYPVVTCNGNKEVIVKEKPFEKLTKTFTFDKVFGPESKQIEVYKSIVHPLINEVLAGYNCTVFAYGQTGTGKTFTMEGEKSMDPSISWEDDPLSGIIPRSLSHLFDELRLLQAEYTVRVSFLELYNEEIFDLLSPTDDASKLKLFEDTTRKGSVIIQGLEEVTVNNKQDVYKIMSKGSEKRTTAATLMNAQSSRSHTVFSITVHIKENSIEGEELLKTGKLNLVDLAGSENISRSGAVDKRAREAGNINQSLLTLGRCITSLVEHCPHVPYRESKLTRLLQESLGGRTKTSIIATISPALSSLEETLSTLDYAHRAKNITNRPEINQKLTKKALLKEYTEEIERLRRDLEAAREKNGVYIAQENYANMLLQIEQQEEEIMNKISALKAVKEEMDKQEEVINTLGMNLQKTIIEKEERNYLIERHIENEEKLRQQALQLTVAVNESTRDAEKLHKKLDGKKKIEEANIKATRLFLDNFQNENSKLNDIISDFHEQAGFLKKQKNSIVSSYEQQCENIQFLKDTSTKLNKMKDDLSIVFTYFQKQSQQSEDSIKTYHTTSNTFSNALKNNLTSVLNLMSKDFSTLSNQMQVLLQNEIQIKNNLLESTNTLEELAYQSINLKNSFSNIHNIFPKIIEFFNKKFDQIKTLEEDLYKAQIQKDESLFSQLNDLENYFTNTVLNIKNSVAKKFDEERRTLLNTVEQTCVKVKDIDDNAQQIGNMLIQQENYCNKFVQFNDCLKTRINEKFSNSVKNIGQCNLISDEIKTKLNEITNEQLLAAYNFDNFSKLFYDKFCSELQNQLKEFEKTTKITEDNLICFTSENERRIDQWSDFLTNFVNKTCTELDTQYNTTISQVKDVNKTIKKQSELVDSFVNNDFQQDITTGQTPEKRIWQYPQRLAEMSPYERLIKRFWKEKSLVVQINDNIDSEILHVESLSENKDKLNCDEFEKGSEDDDSALSSENSTVSVSASVSIST